MTTAPNNVTRTTARNLCRLARETGRHGIIAYENRRYFVRDTEARNVDEVWTLLNSTSPANGAFGKSPTTRKEARKYRSHKRRLKRLGVAA